MIAEHADRYELQLGGFRVTRWAVDFALTLYLDKPRAETKEPRLDAEIRVEGRFSYENANSRIEIDPQHEPAALAPILALRGQCLESATVTKAGELELRFQNGARIRVYSGTKYEAWTLNAPGGVLIVGGVNGMVSIFRP